MARIRARYLLAWLARVGYRNAMQVASRSRFAFERQLAGQGILRIAGVDEAGRGPLAGPVVAAAVILPFSWIASGLPRDLRGLNDSKQLTPEQRDGFYAALSARAEVCFAVGSASHGEIDELNILRATHAAMARALAQLNPGPDHILVDGLPVSAIGRDHTALIAGDTRSYSIAAASVIAKVTRDRLMVEYDRQWPTYGFAEHKGYPTPDHLCVLAQRGPCPIHRRSFAPVDAAQLELFLE